MGGGGGEHGGLGQARLEGMPRHWTMTLFEGIGKTGQAEEERMAQSLRKLFRLTLLMNTRARL